MPHFHPRRNHTPGRVEFPLFAGVSPITPESKNGLRFHCQAETLPQVQVESAFSPSFRQCMGSCINACTVRWRGTAHTKQLPATGALPQGAAWARPAAAAA